MDGLPVMFREETTERLTHRADAAVSTFRRLYAAADLPLEVITHMPIQDRKFRLRVWFSVFIALLGFLCVQIRVVHGQRTSAKEYEQRLRDAGLTSEHMGERIAVLESTTETAEKRLDSMEPRVAANEKAIAAALSTLQWQGNVLLGLGGIGVTLIGALVLRAAKLK